MKMKIFGMVLLGAILSFHVQAQKKYLASHLRNEEVKTDGHYHTLSIVSLFRTEQESKRLEEQLSKAFEANKLTVYPTHEKIHGSGPQVTREQMVQYMTLTGTDIVLVARLIPFSKEKKQLELPPIALSGDPRDTRHPTYKSVETESQNFYANIAPAYKVIDNQEFWKNSATFRIEFSLFDLKQKERLWSGITVFMKEKHLDKQYQLIGEELIDQLQSEGLLKN